MKKIIIAIFILFIIIVGALIFDFGRKDDTKTINFKECALKGYPIQESFPRRCVTPEGVSFVEEADQIKVQDKSDLIKVVSPIPDEVVKSPLLVSGTARGNWYFEGSFPIKLVDENGIEVASGISKAEGDWMTVEFVPFKAELIFKTPISKTGKLILKKDNPSGLPQNDDEIAIAVKFD